MQSQFLITLLLVSFTSFTSAVTDENICDTQCQFCCREKTCRSEDECKGNFSPFIILGAVAGGLVGLIVLRKLYVYLKGKTPDPKEAANKNRSRSRSRNARPKKEKKDTKPLKKSDKTKSSKARSREDVSQKPEEVYLQIDNESIVGVDSNKPDQEQNKNQKLNLLPASGVSKGEISSKSRLEADEKGNTQRSEKKRESSVPKGKTSASTKPGSGKPGASSGKSTSKKPATGSKPGSSKPGTSGERGRSTGTSGKDRASSQPKKSAGTSVEKGKAPIKKNQV